MMMMCGLNVLPFLLVLTTIHLSDELLVFPSNNTTPVSKRINYSLDPFISDFLQTDFRTGRRMRYCPSLKNALPNGFVKIRSNGRIARFSCNEGFSLYGNQYSTCIRNNWNRDLPVCVSKNCKSDITHEAPLVVKKLFQGNVLDLSCELGYDLRVNTSTSDSGSNEENSKMYTITSYMSNTLRLYCVGNKWIIINDWLSNPPIIKTTPLLSFPECEVYQNSVKNSLSCDFELSLCGWFQDNHDDFDWIRNHHTTPSHLEGTGPSFDHTFGKNYLGYYLYLESSYPRAPNDVARLYSPVYQHQDNHSVACFQFYYHMYGKAIGSLRIYIKEKSQLFKRSVWEVVGDQGDNWFAGQVEIYPSSVLKPFQIVIEGELGHGHQGDIAIDDLQLNLGKKCSELNNSTSIDLEIVTEFPDTESENSTVIEDIVYNTSESPLSQGLISKQPNSTLSLVNATVVKSTTAKSVINDSNYRKFNDIVRSIFKIKKTTKANNESTPTSTMPTTKGTIKVLATTTVSPNNTGSNSTKPDKHWWIQLHEHVNEAIRQREILLNNLKNATKPLTLSTKPYNVTEKLAVTSSMVSTTTRIPLVTNITPNASLSKLVKPLASNQHSLSSITTDPIKASSSSSSYVLLITLTALALLIVVIITTLYAYKPIIIGGSSNFVATFASRCKLFHGINDDDSEMLMIDENTGSNCAMTFDNLTDGVVTLQSNGN